MYLRTKGVYKVEIETTIYLDGKYVMPKEQILKNFKSFGKRTSY